MVRLGLRRETAVPEVDLQAETDADLLTLNRLDHHRTVAPLVSRKVDLQRRLRELEERHEHLVRTRAVLEQAQSTALATAEGESWRPPRQLRDVKEQLADTADESRMVQAAVGQIDQDIDAAMGLARSEVERSLQRLKQPHVERMFDGLLALLGENARLREIDRATRRLLSFNSPTCAAGLEGYVSMLQSTRERIARTLGGDDEPT